MNRWNGFISSGEEESRELNPESGAAQLINERMGKSQNPEARFGETIRIPNVTSKHGMVYLSLNLMLNLT
jgi:hypothetical protein